MTTRSDVRKAVELSEVEVSGQTENIIHYVISAVKTDPHPRWKELGDREQFIERLPEYLRDMKQTERVAEEVTTFDFLHWLSRKLDSICPIEKYDK